MGRKRLRSAPLTLALLGLTPAIAIAASCSGAVLQIIDADTIWMRCTGQPVKVRLAQIDAPEVAHPRYGKPGQPYGQQARTDLVGLIGGHTLRLTWTHRGRYHRIIGELYLGSIDVNAWLVARGDAWAYPRSTPE